MYELQNLGVRIDQHVLLEHFSLDFRAGELCMVVGPNGAGKTTLLRCLDGEITPTTGDVRFQGMALDQWRVRDLARVRAVLPQYSNLDFPFSVRDVVLMGRMPHDTTRRTNLDIVDQALRRCDCLGLADRAFPTLSGGERQRTHTARVLTQIWESVPDFERFVLLDEPISALDLSHQYALLTLLKSLVHSQGIGVICTLHNLNLAAQFADRCLIIDQGRLVADGRPAEVFTEETLSNVFDLDIWLQTHPEDAKIPLIVPKLSASQGLDIPDQRVRDSRVPD